jgi:hypothetical protein
MFFNTFVTSPQAQITVLQHIDGSFNAWSAAILSTFVAGTLTQLSLLWAEPEAARNGSRGDAATGRQLLTR